MGWGRRCSRDAKNELKREGRELLDTKTLNENTGYNNYTECDCNVLHNDASYLENSNIPTNICPKCPPGAMKSGA
jgi:hypothetical protein